MKDKKNKQTETFSDEITRGFRRFKRVRLVFSAIKSSNTVLFGFAGGLTLWVSSLLILWIIGSEYGLLADSFIQHIPYFCSGVFLFLIIASVIGNIKLKRKHIGLNHYIHWCDVENKYDSELLTAFEKVNSGSELSSFDELIDNNAKSRIELKGVPKSYTVLDIKHAYKFAGLLTYIVLLILVIGGIKYAADAENSEIAYNDDVKNQEKTDLADADKDKKLENKDDEKTEKDAEKKSDSENVNSPSKTEKKPEEVEKQDKKEDDDADDGKNDNKDTTSDKTEKKEDRKPEPKPKNEDNDNNENTEKDNMNNKPKDNQDKAKFELDPLKTSPEATKGETKTKKEKFYHIDSENDAEGSLIDAEKLLARLKQSENNDKSLPLSIKEKKLIEKYRNKLEKILSSR